MVKWICIHCGKRMYSSCGNQHDRTVKCIYCGKQIKNPYFKGPEKVEN